jgi:hypothetical protein
VLFEDDLAIRAEKYRVSIERRLPTLGPLVQTPGYDRGMKQYRSYYQQTYSYNNEDPAGAEREPGAGVMIIGNNGLRSTGAGRP